MVDHPSHYNNSSLQFHSQIISIDTKFMFISRKIPSLFTIDTDKQCINMVLSWYLYVKINEFITIIFIMIILIWIHSLKFALSIRRRNDTPFNLFYLFIHLSFWWWSRKTENSTKLFFHSSMCIYSLVLFFYWYKIHVYLEKDSLSLHDHYRIQCDSLPWIPVDAFCHYLWFPRILSFFLFRVVCTGKINELLIDV